MSSHHEYYQFFGKRCIPRDTIISPSKLIVLFCTSVPLPSLTAQFTATAGDKVRSGTRKMTISYYWLRIQFRFSVEYPIPFTICQDFPKHDSPTPASSLCGSPVHRRSQGAECRGGGNFTSSGKLLIWRQIRLCLFLGSSMRMQIIFVRLLWKTPVPFHLYSSIWEKG